MRGTVGIEPGARARAAARTVTASSSRRGQAIGQLPETTTAGRSSGRHHVIASSLRRARQRHDGGRQRTPGSGIGPSQQGWAPVIRQHRVWAARP